MRSKLSLLAVETGRQVLRAMLTFARRLGNIKCARAAVMIVSLVRHHIVTKV